MKKLKTTNEDVDKSKINKLKITNNNFAKAQRRKLKTTKDEIETTNGEIEKPQMKNQKMVQRGCKWN